MSAPHPLNQAVIAQALHDLRNGPLYEWDARRTVQANSWDLLRLNSADHLTLTNLGRRVANLLEKGNSHR